MIFDPPLPETTTHVLKRMPAGRITKIIATYSTVSEIMTLHQRYYNISGHPIFTPSQHPHCTSAPFYTPRPTSSPRVHSLPTLYFYTHPLFLCPHPIPNIPSKGVLEVVWLQRIRSDERRHIS